MSVRCPQFFCLSVIRVMCASSWPAKKKTMMASPDPRQQRRRRHDGLILTVFCLGFLYHGIPLVAGLSLMPSPSKTSHKTTAKTKTRTRRITTAQFPGGEPTFLTKRRVSVQSVPWCGSKGMLPLQTYHGHALDAALPQPQPQLETTNLSNVSALLAAKTTFSKSTISMLEAFQQTTASSSTTTTREEQKRILLQKIQAEARASAPLDPHDHLHILYRDHHICVVHKPSGILCVPGARRNPSLANLVHHHCRLDDETMSVDHTVVHRLDMDTSGIVVFALTGQAAKKLHDDFRCRVVHKTYHALVCGHLTAAAEGEIDLDLERDPSNPPFMRVATHQPTSISSVDEPPPPPLHHPYYQKLIDQAPKPSFTSFRVLSREYLRGCPVTRLELTPRTGRTHQLRVHCAAIGHAIVGDPIYGYGGQGAPHGGLVGEQLEAFVDRAPTKVQQDLAQNLSGGLPLCLHAQQLCLHHPHTQSPMIFSAASNF